MRQIDKGGFLGGMQGRMQRYIHELRLGEKWKEGTGGCVFSTRK